MVGSVDTVDSFGGDDGATPPGLAPTRGYRTDIQALRGLAVLLVVLFHAQILTPGGYVGVDVFFVISGFVIGRRLVGELATTGRLSFRGFYERRARRILPALAAMLALVLLATPFLAPIAIGPTTNRTGIAASLFSANFYLYRATGGGYFAPSADLNPLLHTWSLSVEEQFYFVIPALLAASVWAMRRRASVGTLRVVVGALTVGSFALCVLFSFSTTVGSLQGLRFAFFSPFTRAWEFAAGIVLVLLPSRWAVPSRARGVVRVAGLGAIAVAAFAFDDATRFPGIAALLPVLGAALVIAAGTAAEPSGPDGPSAWLRPMVGLGDVSYSWYLWHWPLIVFAAAFWPHAGRLPLVVAAAVSVLPAWWSYRLLETRLRPRPPRRSATVVLAVVCILTPLVAAVVARPVARRVDRRTAVATYRVALEPPEAQALCHSSTPLSQRDPSQCGFGPAGATRTVALVGDSNALQFSDAFIGAAARDDARVRIATASFCPFMDAVRVTSPPETGEKSDDVCRAWFQGTMDALVADPPDVVVIGNSTDDYVTDRITSAVSLRDTAAGATASGDARPAAYVDAMARTVRRLEAAGSRVVLLGIVPKPYGWDPRSCSPLAIMAAPGNCAPASYAPGSRTGEDEARRTERRLADRTGVALWRFDGRICPSGVCGGSAASTDTWRDDVHISVVEARSLVDAVADRLDGVLPASGSSGSSG